MNGIKYNAVNAGNRVNRSFSDYTWEFTSYTIVIFFALICLIPFVLVIIVSFTDETMILRYGYSLFPKKFSLDAYKFIFSRGSDILNSYKVSIIVTSVGSVMSLLMVCMFAYVLSRKTLKYRNVISFYMFFTMLFSGGLVPFFVLVTSLGLRNTYWAMILPSLMNAWNVYLMRNFFNTIPETIFESVKIDGAGEMTIFVRFALPLSLPGIATVFLFIVVGYWNDWFSAILFISKAELYPLQAMLRFIMSNLAQLNMSAQLMATARKLPEESVKMATMVITIGPIIFVYPFLQKYFVQGIVIGAVKG